MSRVQKTVSWVGVMITFILQHRRKTLAHILLMISYNLGPLEFLFVPHLFICAVNHSWQMNILLFGPVRFHPVFSYNFSNLPS